MFDIFLVKNAQNIDSYCPKLGQIRGKLDAYVEAAFSQTDAYDDAVSILDRYTSKCSADLHDLNKAQII